MSGAVGGIYGEIRADVDPFIRSLNQAKGRMASTGQSIGRENKAIGDSFKSLPMAINPATLAMGAVAAGVTAAGAAIKASISIGMEFESTMNAVGAVSRATKEEYAQLEAAAREMGATTEWSASQSAEALKFLSMAGMGVQDSVQALPGMLDLATAAQMDLGSAADIVTDTLTAFGMETSELTRLSDAFINTSTRSNTTVSMLGESFKYVSPIAAQMGYSVEETSGLLGVMANAGIKASDAGTDLRQVLLRTSKAAKSLGMDAGATLNEVLKEMAARQLTANEVTGMFGMIASKSAMVLMNNVDAVGKLTTELEANQGATAQTAAVMRESTENMKATFFSTMEEVGLSVFDAIQGDVRDAFTVATQFVRDNSAVFVDWADKIATVSGIAFDVVIVGAGMVSDAFNGWSIIWETLKVCFFEFSSGINQDILNLLTSMQSLTAFVSDDMAEKFNGSISAIRQNMAYWNEQSGQAQIKIMDLGAKGSATFNALKSVVGSATDEIKKQGEQAAATTDAIVKKVSETGTAIKNQQAEVSAEAEKQAEKQKKIIADATAEMYRELGYQAEGYQAYKVAQYKKEYADYVKHTGDIKNAQIRLDKKLKGLEDDHRKYLLAGYDDDLKNFENKTWKDEKSKLGAWQTLRSKIKAEMSGLSQDQVAALDGMISDVDAKLNSRSNSMVSKWDDFKGLVSGRGGILAALRGDQKKSLGKMVGDTKSGLSGNSNSMASAWGDFATEATQNFDVDFTQVIKGDFSSIEDAFKTTMGNMLGNLIDTAAQMIVEWAATQVISWGSDALTWLSAESGVWDMDSTQIGQMYPDSQGAPGTPTVIHDGEMVVPPGVADQIRTSMAQNGINDFAGMSEAIGQIGAGITPGVGGFGAKSRLDETLDVFGKSFFNDMGKHGLGVLGAATEAKDISFSDVVGQIADKTAVADAALGALATAVNTVAGARTDPYGTIGQTVGSFLGSLTGNPIGKAISAIVGAFSGMGLGDALDDRSLEDVRDAFEDVYGWFGGLGAFKGFLEDKEIGLVGGISKENGFLGDDLGISNPGFGFGFESFDGTGNFETPSGFGGDFGGDSTGGGYGGGENGGANDGSDNDNSGIGGWKNGGIIDRLMVPDGEDGLAALKFGEGVVSKRGMENLDKINNGDLGGGYEVGRLIREIKRQTRFLKKFDELGMLERAVA